jgi:hypothetical protein
MNLLQARLALIALRFEAKTGMLMTAKNKVNTYRVVATALGYGPKSKPKIADLISGLEASIKHTEELLAKEQETAQA